MSQDAIASLLTDLPVGLYGLTPPNVTGSLGLLLVCSLVFGALITLRPLCSIALARHPVFIACLAFFILPESSSARGAAILLGVFFELLWLDLFYVGTYVPPQALFSYASCLYLAHEFSAGAPETLTFIIILCLPLAYLGSFLENLQRKRQNFWYDKLADAPHRAGRIRQITARAVHASAALSLFGAAAGFFAATLLLEVGLKLYLQILPWPIAHNLNWPYLLALSALGGILSLRIRWATLAFTGGALLVGGIAIL